jgi:hypothetical protein
MSAQTGSTNTSNNARAASSLAFCRYVRTPAPRKVPVHFIFDNFSPHLGQKMRDWAATTAWNWPD